LNLTGGGNPERIQGIRVSAGLFPALGVPAARGRFFLPEEDRTGGEAVVVVSDGLWKRRFGGDRALVGRSLVLNGKSHTVVGIMPPGFGFPSPSTEMWIPLALPSEELDPARRGNEFLQAAVARLRPGITVPLAQNDMDRITRTILASLPQAARDYFAGAGWGSVVAPLKEHVVGASRTALLTLLGAVVFVLLVACANVSCLQLARAASRQREMAIRAALGAGRGSIVRQLLSESLLLALVGGEVGMLVAVWGVDLLVTMRPANFPRLEEVRIDSGVLAFTVAISILSAVLFGLAPAFRLSRTGPNEALKEGTRSATAGVKQLRGQQLLVMTQVALALVLMIGAGLMLRSFRNLQQVDPGFKTENVLTTYISLPPAKYSEPEKNLEFFRQLLRRLQTLPGVESVAAGSLVPLAEGWSTASFFAEGQARRPGEILPLASIRVVTPGYFRTMGIPLLQGRDFTDRDDRTSVRVVAVDRGTARRLWPAEDPIGKRITFSDSVKDAVWLTVAGVVGDIKDLALDRDPMLHVYLPLGGSPQGAMFLALRTRTDAAGFLPAVREQVRAMDADQPIFAVRTMDSYVDDALAQPRLRFNLVALFAGVALLLASLGVYSVISYSVARRTHEIGIRMTLGARRRDVVGLIVRQGLPLILLGSGIGLGAAWGLTRVLDTLLYGVGAHDPGTFAGVSLLLVLVASAACYLPARRAATVDPMIALRYE
ncbi:MAG TPA: ABC transporter permease, partial [Candidatus Polarisedimenticolia bacterium]|nr:ABC transporter permease [Candidatus Polarisedimenticolia bacterium]